MLERTVTGSSQVIEQEIPSAQGRSQKMASALSFYARALHFENRSRRNLYRLAGLTPKTRDRVFSVLLIVIVFLTFVLPMAASTAYYTLVASPGYVSEVRFVVRSAVPLLSRDRYSSDAVEPKAKIVQDTAVLLNYLSSHAMVQDLQASVDFREVYGRDNIDPLSRLSKNSAQDDVLKYWNNHYLASVNIKSGIVQLDVTAFSPKEAHDIAQLVLKLSEKQINKLSSGMWDDVLTSTQKDVDQASKELGDLRAKFRDTQNQTGIFDVDQSAKSIISVLTTVESRIAELSSRRVALRQSVKEGAPQLSDIDRQIAALREQAMQIQARATGSSSNTGNLADYSSTFDQIKLDVGMAEKKLQSAIIDLEKVKLVSSLQLVYLDNFTAPTTPDTNKYPNVPLTLFLHLLVFTAVCSIACGILTAIRKKMD